MTDISNLESRINAEFAAVEAKVKDFQTERAEEHRQREQRLEQLGRVFEELREVWRPRLEFLLERFANQVQATPRFVPSAREATFSFRSDLAHVRLKLSASTDRDVRKVVLSYDLQIIPVLMRFNSHDEIEFPLDAVDKEAVAKWLDDRLVEFVRTYFSMGENEIYLKAHMVEDPIAHVRFPKQAAGATLDWQGKTFYFIGEETRREFAEQNKIRLKAEG